MGEETAWRALADALTHARTSAIINPEDVLATAREALAWLRLRGFDLDAYDRLRARVVQLEDAIRTHSCGIGIGCRCPGVADGDVHEPGCQGVRATQAERDLKAVLDDQEARQ